MGRDESIERLSREDWLRKALEQLSKEGEGELRIDSISRALGVTKGSFYWHFKNRAEFLEAMLVYWAVAYNQRVVEVAEEGGRSAREKLRLVLKTVTEDDLSRYDSAFDAWAAHEPGIAEKVKEVYLIRYKYVRGLLREMGFRGIDLETRTVALIGFIKEEVSITGKPRPKRSAARIERELEFFVGPEGEG